MSGGGEVAEYDALGAFLRFADNVQANVERAHRPAYTETCGCGGSVEVGRDVTRADLRRIHANFLGRHRDCMSPTAPLAPVLGQLGGFGLLRSDEGETDLGPITGGLDESVEVVTSPGEPR